MSEPLAPTVKSVVAHAEKISVAVAHLRAKDPFCNPWFPTTASARRQYNRELTVVRTEAQEANVRTLVMGDEDPDELDVAALEAEAARRAMRWMDQRFAREQVEYREHEETARRSRNRHRRRSIEAAADRDALRRGLTPGQRIDQALTLLSAVSNAPVMVLDADRVSGTATAGEPRFPGDASGRARHLAIECVRAVEQEAEEAKRRMVELEKAS